MNKQALIFDTNFIIEHSKDLTAVVEKLSKTYEIFVTQLSIDERMSQQYFGKFNISAVLKHLKFI